MFTLYSLLMQLLQLQAWAKLVACQKLLCCWSDKQHDLLQALCKPLITLYSVPAAFLVQLQAGSIPPAGRTTADKLMR